MMSEPYVFSRLACGGGAATRVNKAANTRGAATDCASEPSTTSIHDSSNWGRCGPTCCQQNLIVCLVDAVGKRVSVDISRCSVCCVTGVELPDVNWARLGQMACKGDPIGRSTGDRWRPL